MRADDLFRYFVQGATGREVIIFDFHPNTGAYPPLTWILERSSYDRYLATNIVAKDIFATTKSGQPVAVMCDPAAVSLCCCQEAVASWD